MKTKLTIKILGLSAGLIMSLNLKSQAWDVNGNNVNFGSNLLGTLTSSPAKEFNVITDGLVRVRFNNSYRTDFTGPTTIKVDVNDATIGVIQPLRNKVSGKNISMLGSEEFINAFGNFVPSSNIHMKASNIFLQYTNALPSDGTLTNNGKVLIGEPTTFPTGAFTPKLQVRGDNIGLVSSGTFGSTVFNGTDQWLSLGKRQPATVAGSNSYGIRAQWTAYAIDAAVQERTSGTVRDAVLTWQDGTFNTDICTTPLGVNNSAFRFVFRNGATPSSAGSALEAARFLFKAPTIPSLCSNAAFFGINNTNPLYELDVRGKINASSQVLANAIVLTSDRRFKKDIVSIENGLDIIKQLNPVNYKFKVDEFKDRYDFDNTLQYGFIAQELETILPSTVVEMQDGYKGVNYTMLIPILTNAIKTMNANTESKFQKMESEMQALKNENSSMRKALNNSGLQNSEIGSDEASDIKLLQNVPNPFGNSTMIQYDLGSQLKNIKLVISDLNGKTIQVFNDLQSSGKIEVSADALTNGIYIYSLVNNNSEVVLSKQMLVQK